MLRQALANSMAAPSPMIQVPALTEGSEVLGVAPAQGGATRTPEEVEQLAVRAAERVTELKEEATRVSTQLAETADAVAILLGETPQVLHGGVSVSGEHGL